jgi:hypothetical protein
MTVVTPKGSFYPIPETVNLGDSQTVEDIMEEHLLNFTKGILPRPEIKANKHPNRDLDILERLGNARALMQADFKDNAYQSELDVALFVYTSDKTHTSWKK